MKLKIINNSNNPPPSYQTAGAAAVDLHAYLREEIVLMPGERALVPTGIQLELPKGYEAQIRPRSGLAFKSGVTVLNTPGTIDSDYRGDVGVILINHGKEPFTTKNGDRIAQMVFAKAPQVELVEVDHVEETERGEDGFGSTKV